MPLALICGAGRLPAQLAPAADMVCALEGFLPDAVDPDLVFALERLGTLFDALHGAGIDRVCLAGTVRRPPLDPTRLDDFTRALAQRLVSVMHRGDDGALGMILALFEEEGFEIVGAHEVVPHLLPEAGILGAVPPSPQDEADAARAARLVEAIGAVDVGQGAVVAGGLALALETLPGTDWMLDSLARLGPLRPDPARGRGVLYKAPKPGQDRRVDLPAIGPVTVAGVARAGLAGIAVEAGGILLVDRAATIAAADAAGLFLWVRPAEGG